MAFLRIVVISSLALMGCHATHADAERYAKEWLRMHAGADPDQAGMDELKATNPDAFAIVNALLTKRSLGMLNLKHPSASFKPNADADPQEGPTAVDVLRASEQQPASSVEAPVAAVSVSSYSAPTSSHNWLNWKPHSSEDDDAMVKNVLGAVADLKSGTSAATPASATGSLLSDSRSESETMVDAPASQETAPPAEQHRLGALSYEWGTTQTQSAAQQAAAPQMEAPQSREPQNSYLAGIGGGFMGGSSSSPAKAAASQGNLLTSFSWDSSASSDQPQADTGYLQQQGAQEQVAAKSSSFGGGALGHWLR